MDTQVATRSVAEKCGSCMHDHPTLLCRAPRLRKEDASGKNREVGRGYFRAAVIVFRCGGLRDRRSSPSGWRETL